MFEFFEVVGGLTCIIGFVIGVMGAFELIFDYRRLKERVSVLEEKMGIPKRKRTPLIPQ